MVLQVGLVHYIVNEAGSILNAGCISCRIRTVKGKSEVEVRELLLNLCEVLKIEGLYKSTGAIEEANGLLGLQGLEQMHDVAAKRSHTSTTTYEDVFLGVGIVVRKKELAVRTGNHNLVTRLAGEYIGRCDSRRNAGHELEDALRLCTVERRSCDTYVQLDDVLLCRIRGHGVCADGRNGILVLQGSDTVLLPVALVDIVYVHVREIGLVLRNINLNILS